MTSGQKAAFMRKWLQAAETVDHEIGYDAMTPGQKAAFKRKWRRAAKRARNAKLFTKYRLGQAGWRVATFDTPKGFDYRGIVDLVAVKRDNLMPDHLTVMLLQVKGGAARVTPIEIDRLKAATKNIRVIWNVATKLGSSVSFLRKLD